MQKKISFILFLLVALIGCHTRVCAQIQSSDDNKAFKLLYDVDFLSYFDNREYDLVYQIPQTIMGVRFAPEVGFGVNIGGDESHKIMLGVNYIQPLGSELNESTIVPTAYYQFVKNGFRMSLGAVPFSYLSQALPEIMMYDSLVYMHPNIQGALLQYNSEHGFVDFMCDWRSRQTVERYEAFRLIFNGCYSRNYLYAGGRMQMNHLANRLAPAERTGVNDDILINPYLGIDFSNKNNFDSLSFQIGYVGGIQRNRFIETTYSPHGFNAEFYLQWRFLGIKDHLYVGDCQYPLYSQKGNLLNQGDPFYQSELYNRLDMFVYLIRNNFVNCYFSWNLHYTDAGMDNQQQLIVRFCLDGLNRNRKLRGFFDK